MKSFYFMFNTRKKGFKLIDTILNECQIKQNYKVLLFHIIF